MLLGEWSYSFAIPDLGNWIELSGQPCYSNVLVLWVRGPKVAKWLEQTVRYPLADIGFKGDL
jgi:hypothetical protein